MRPSFAVWLTGLPGSGKSTIVRALVDALAERGQHPAVLESDALREILTPKPTYSSEERDAFYRAVTYIATLLTVHGVPVIVDATANRAAYRAAARAGIGDFVEVYVDCPLAVCRARDPKGIYRRAEAGEASTVPGVQSPYEPPEHPDLVVSGTGDPRDAARRIVGVLDERSVLGGSVARPPS